MGDDGARGRPSLSLYEAIPRFSRDKSGIRALHVVAEWGLLLVIVGALLFLFSAFKRAAPDPHASYNQS